MLKLQLYMAILSSLSLLLFSCSDNNDIVPDETAKTESVVIKASIPQQIRSRAGHVYGDGSAIQRLRYAIYDTDDNVIYSSDMPSAPQPKSDDNNSWSLALELVRGENYKIFFWADESYFNIYSIDYINGSVAQTIPEFTQYEGSLSPQGNPSLAECFDAFYCYQQFTAGQMSSFTLTRPLAQIIVCTNSADIYDDYLMNNSCSLVHFTDPVSSPMPPVGKVPSTFNFRTGTVGNYREAFVQYFNPWNYRGLYAVPGYENDENMTAINLSYIFAPKSTDGWGNYMYRNLSMNFYNPYADISFASGSIVPADGTQTMSWLKANTRVIVNIAGNGGCGEEEDFSFEIIVKSDLSGDNSITK